MRDPRYALLLGDHVLAFCHDVDGLYGEPVPRPRVRHELRGCAPRGELARAVTQAVVEGAAPLGTLDVETPDGTWRFEAVRVLGARGDVVTIEAAAGGPSRRPGPTAGATPCAHLIRVTREPPPELTHTDVTFLGCSPRGRLRDELAAGPEGLGAVRYEVLDRPGNGQHGGEAGRITAWDASGTHHGLLDLTVAFPRSGLIPPRRREVWDLFSGHGRPAGHDGPAEPGTWRRFTGADRAEWLRQAARRGAHGAPAFVPGATYHLDGTGVVDTDAFACALGEAVRGPGRTLIDEDLRGSTLVWHRSDVARACLGVTPLRAEPRPATFQELVDALRAEGVRVVLD